MKGSAYLGVLVCIAVICASFPVSTASITSPQGTFKIGYNLFALPAIPLWDGVSGRAPGYPPSVLDEYDRIPKRAGLDFRKLSRWDSAKQQYVIFDEHRPASFGNLSVGDGYAINLIMRDSSRVSFNGISENDTADMWISLPKAGWTLIGYPHSYPSPDPYPGPPYYVGTPYYWADVKVTDGIETKSLRDASQYGANWLSSVALWYDNTSGREVTLGLPDDNPDEQSLIGWHGYWVRTYKDDLALIFEAP